MRAKRIYEFGGAGFAYGGGSSTLMGRGGVNRGGFGGANNLGGPNMMYTYEIKPLNRTLQPDPLGSPEIEEIKPGNDISGREVNKRDGELRVGSLHRVVRAEDGSVKYYEIMDTNSATYIRIDPTTAQLISKLDGVDPLGTDLSSEEEDLMNVGQIVHESLYESMRTYDDFVEDLRDLMINKGVKQQQIDDSLDYFHGKGYLEDYWQQGFGPSEAYSEIKTMEYWSNSSRKFMWIF